MLIHNIPNPFSGKTIIQYYIPEDAGNAYIQITTVNGAVLKTINVTKGNGQIELEINNMTSGNYLYSLIIDDKEIETKTMVLQK